MSAALRQCVPFVWLSEESVIIAWRALSRMSHVCHVSQSVSHSVSQVPLYDMT